MPACLGIAAGHRRGDARALLRRCARLCSEYGVNGAANLLEPSSCGLRIAGVCARDFAFGHVQEPGGKKHAVVLGSLGVQTSRREASRRLVAFSRLAPIKNWRSSGALLQPAKFKALMP